MKKTVLFFTLFSFSLILFNSCKKTEKAVQQSSHSISATAEISESSVEGIELTQEGYLKFSDRDAYDAVLEIIKDYSDEQMDEWEGTLGFVSAYTTFQSPQTYGVSPSDNNNTIMEDPLFLRIIDRNGVIQIGDYIFRAEANNDRVLEMHENNKSGYFAQFKTGSFEPTVMNELCSATETEEGDDIFEILATNVTGITKTTGTPTGITGTGGAYIGCATNSGNNSTRKYNDDKSNGSTTYRADCKSVYQAVVFYFSLMSELKYMRGGPTIWTQQSTSISYSTGWGTYCNFKPKNRAWQYPSVPGGTTSHKLTWRPYSGSRKLTNYDMNAIFLYTAWCGQTASVQVRDHN